MKSLFIYIIIEHFLVNIQFNLKIASLKHEIMSQTRCYLFTYYKTLDKSFAFFDVLVIEIFAEVNLLQ